MSKVLSNVSSYVNDKISNSKLTSHNYVGVDNLLPNQYGKIDSVYVPTKGNSTHFRKGDILIGNIRPYFKKIWIAEYEGGCSPDVLCIRANSNFSAEYLYAYLSQDCFFDYIMSAPKGSKMPRGDKNHIMRFPIMTNKNMNKIGNFIISINKKIEINNLINEKLQKIAYDLYDYWFLQFDFPNKEGKPYRTSEGKMIWNEKLKKEIPLGWKDGTLNSFISEQIAGDWGKESAEKNHNHEVYCLRGTDFGALSSNNILEAPKRFILKKNSDEKKLDDGDILVEISGGSPTQSTGRVCYINSESLKRFDKELIVSNFCRCLRPKNKQYTYWLYCTWSKLYNAGLFFGYESKTTGIKNLLLDIFLTNYGVVIPPQTVIIEFHNKVKSMFATIQKNKIENDKLVKLKNYLLPLLANGQISIKESSKNDC